MASEAAILKLFETAKASGQFAGMAEKDIQKACLAYKDRPDRDIWRAIGNIKEKDEDEEYESAKKQAKLEQGKQKMVTMRKEEAIDHKQDERKAESLLQDLFS